MHTGPEIGAVLEHIFEAVLSGELPNNRSELLARAKELIGCDNAEFDPARNNAAAHNKE